MSKLIPEVCEAICFLQIACESIPPPRQRFHLVDKLITAREFNAHVRDPVQIQGCVYSTILMAHVYKVKHTLGFRQTEICVSLKA